LYLSQVMAHDDPRRASLPDEKLTLAPLFAALDVDADIVDATCEPLPDARAYAGVIIGGSAGSVHDRERWRVQLHAWLRERLDAPFLGLCGGHQLYAALHGARVERMAEPQLGCCPLELPDVPGFRGWVMQMHHEVVVDVPDGASLWARDEVGIQALRYAGSRWTVQFHPEISAEVARGAGRSSGATEASWPEPQLQAAVAGGRAVIAAWLASLR
jgi:GMP synthase-like glutamine amidotransferase